MCDEPKERLRRRLHVSLTTMRFHLQVLIAAMYFQRLIRLCGEVKAAPSENEEIQFLCVVCAKLRQDPYLVNFFLEVRHKLVTIHDLT